MKYDLIDLDPRELLQFDGNVRADLGDLAGMVETMKQVGVVQPLHVVFSIEDGYWRILAGKRRAAAAIKAGLETVPCLYREANGTEPSVSDDRVRSLVENVQRKDLTAAEESEGWAQLQICGLDVDTIATVTGLEVERVQRGLTVAASKTAAAVTRKYDLTLEQGIVIAEFDDDKEAVKELTALAVRDPGRFAHTASRMRQDRESAKLIAEATAKLEKQGVAVLDDKTRVGYSTLREPRRISELVDGEGKKLTAASHRKCPGARARIRGSWNGKVEVEHVCLEPAENGHKELHARNRGHDSGTPSESAEAAKEQRSATIAGNKAWRAAEPVRRQFVIDLLKRRKVPTQVLPFVAEEVLTDPHGLTTGTDGMLSAMSGIRTATDVYGAKLGLAVLAKATTATLPLAMLTAVASAREATLDVHTWRNPSKDGAPARWLRFLASVGYTLSDIERVVAEAKR